MSGGDSAKRCSAGHEVGRRFDTNREEWSAWEPGCAGGTGKWDSDPSKVPQEGELLRGSGPGLPASGSYSWSLSVSLLLTGGQKGDRTATVCSNYPGCLSQGKHSSTPLLFPDKKAHWCKQLILTKWGINKVRILSAWMSVICFFPLDFCLSNAALTMSRTATESRQGLGSVPKRFPLYFFSLDQPHTSLASSNFCLDLISTSFNKDRSGLFIQASLQTGNRLSCSTLMGIIFVYTHLCVGAHVWGVFWVCTLNPQMGTVFWAGGSRGAEPLNWVCTCSSWGIILYCTYSRAEQGLRSVCALLLRYKFCEAQGKKKLKNILASK